MPARKAARRLGMAALPALALLVLGGCAESGNFRPSCPSVGVLRDAGTLRIDGAGGSVEAVAVMTSLPAQCEYNERGVGVSAFLTIQATRQEGSSLTAVPVQYFVAITDAERNILAKQNFTTTVPLTGDSGWVRETLTQFIPVPPTKDARWHEVLIGFQLTPEQAEINRTMNELRR